MKKLAAILASLALVLGFFGAAAILASPASAKDTSWGKQVQQKDTSWGRVKAAKDTSWGRVVQQKDTSWGKVKAKPRALKDITWGKDTSWGKQAAAKRKAGGIQHYSPDDGFDDAFLVQVNGSNRYISKGASGAADRVYVGSGKQIVCMTTYGWRVRYDATGWHDLNWWDNPLCVHQLD